MKYLCAIVVLFLTWTSLSARASDKDKSFKEEPLDGVTIEALEVYRNPRNNSIDFGLGIWPLSPYYNSFSVDASYNYLFNKKYTWEVLRASYIYSIDKGLTSEIADRYQLEPKVIERLNFMISTNLKYNLAYGKFIFFNEHIRYFRAQIIVGPALAITNSRSQIGADLGAAMEVYVNDYFSWKLDIRDTLVTVGTTTNNMSINLGTGYAF